MRTSATKKSMQQRNRAFASGLLPRKGQSAHRGESVGSVVSIHARMGAPQTMCYFAGPWGNGTRALTKEQVKESLYNGFVFILFFLPLCPPHGALGAKLQINNYTRDKVRYLLFPVFSSFRTSARTGKSKLYVVESSVSFGARALSFCFFSCPFICGGNGKQRIEEVVKKKELCASFLRCCMRISGGPRFFLAVVASRYFADPFASHTFSYDEEKPATVSCIARDARSQKRKKENRRPRDPNTDRLGIQRNTGIA